MAQLQARAMGFEQFLDWERRQQRKHEVVDGRPIAMAGGTGEWSCLMSIPGWCPAGNAGHAPRAAVN